MKTYTPRPRDIERRWYVIDASGAVLGRLASEVAAILRGKHKPIFAPHMDTGDNVIVVNAAGVRLTGGKEQKKIAYRHSGYPGGLRETTYARLMATKPVYVVEKAIKGMLPKNRLGRAMGKKLQVYAGPEHPHQAQKPQPLALGEVPRWDGLPKHEPKPVKAPEPKAPKRRRTEKPTPKRAAAKRPAAKRPRAKPPAVKRAAAKRTEAKRPAAKAKPAGAKAKATAAKAAGGEATTTEAAKPKRATAKAATPKPTAKKATSTKRATTKRITAKLTPRRRKPAAEEAPKTGEAKASPRRRAKKED
jgi:large subunit ribosomal protein L13